MADLDLDLALADLAANLDAPGPPDLAQRVGAELRARPVRTRRVTWRTWLAAVAAFLTPTVLLSDAIAGRLGPDRVEVRQAPLPDRVGTELDLGGAVALDEAARRAGFPLLVPARSLLGDPDQVLLDESEGAVTLAWGDTTLFTQLRGDLPRPFIGKVLGAANVAEVDVDGSAGLWIEGPPHVVFHIDEGNAYNEDETRLAANVLLWARDGVTYRLETKGDRKTALHIARNLRPVRGVTDT